MGNNTISIKQIAELAGTSVATVSRVINRNGRYSKETEEKILQIMKEHNYQPNYLAKALRENKTNLVGILLPDINHPFFACFFRATELRLFEHGYLPVLCDTNEDLNLESKYIENLSNLCFCGMISLNGNIVNLPGDVPTLYVDRYPDLEPIDDIYFLGSDNFKGGYLATEALIKAGKKNIAMVLHNKALMTLKHRYDGFIKAMDDNNMTFNPELMYTTPNVTFDDGYEVTRNLVEAGVDCDAIFYSSDMLALGGLRYFHDHNIPVPEKYAIIGFDDIPLSILTELSTIHQEIEEMGVHAADMIVDMINGNEVDKNLILDVELVQRASID